MPESAAKGRSEAFQTVNQPQPVLLQTEVIEEAESPVP